jgi:hypothetical protein
LFAHDPGGVRGLWEGRVTRRLAGSELLRSARAVAESVLSTWPELVRPAAADAERDVSSSSRWASSTPAEVIGS